MRKLLIGLGVLVVLLIAAVAVVEIGGRPVAEGYIREQVVKAFPGTDPTVVIAPGSLVLQAIGGHLDRVDVTIPDATIGTFESDLTATATDVPLDSSAPLGTLTIGVDVSAGQVQQIVRGLDGLSKASVSIGGTREVEITSSFSVLGITVPYGFGVAPSVDSADLVLTPTSVSLNNAKLSLADLSKVPFGSNIVDLVKPQRVCIAAYLPRVLTLTKAATTAGALHLTATGGGIALASTDFTKLGSCG